MYDFKIDKSKNRLFISLSNEITRTEGQKIYSELVIAVNQLKRGFDVITDISGLVTTSKQNEELLKTSMKFMKLRGVNRIVRVVGSSKEGLMIFANTTKTIENYQVHYVPKVEDAEKLLGQEAVGSSQ